MSSPPFVHLHCHSHYSLLDGASKIPDLVRHVKALGMPAVALTDHGNLYGAIEFLREAKAAGILPIVGMEAYVAPGRRTERSGGGASGRRARLPPDPAGEERRRLPQPDAALVALVPGGLLLQAADRQGDPRSTHRGADLPVRLRSAEFSDFILHGKTAEAERLCAWYQKIFGEENFFVEIQNNGVEIQRDCAEGAIDIARRLGLPLVATSDAHYLTRDDAAAHDVLLCINTGKTLDDPTRMRFDTAGVLRPQPGGDVRGVARPRGGPGDLGADRRDGRAELRELRPGQALLPLVQPRRSGKTPEDYLRELCEDGPARALRRPPRPRGRASGSTTSWASSTGWGSPRTS